MLSAKLLTAFDYSLVTLLDIPSASNKIFIPKSSLPFPSTLATEFI
jgi:hypothetical protein